MFIRLNKNLIKQRLNINGVSDTLNIIEVIEYCKKIITSLFGKKSLEYIKSIYIKNSVLFIKINNSSISSEIKKKEERIINLLNQKSDKKIKRISFKI